MSSYYITAKSKISNELHEFQAIDDYFGRHLYGFRSLIDNDIVLTENEFRKTYDTIKQRKVVDKSFVKDTVMQNNRMQSPKERKRRISVENTGWVREDGTKDIINIPNDVVLLRVRTNQIHFWFQGILINGEVQKLPAKIRRGDIVRLPEPQYIEEMLKKLTSPKSESIILAEDSDIFIYASSKYDNDTIVSIEARVNNHTFFKKSLLPGEKSDVSGFLLSGSVLNVITQGDIDWIVWGNKKELLSSED